MDKAVLISIRPEWVGKIITGEKTVEIRKTRPKMETPFRCYIRVQMLLDDAPTVDAVPIVRCRECKYNIGHGEADYCIRMDIFFRCHPEFFCGYGKRRCNNA